MAPPRRPEKRPPARPGGGAGFVPTVKLDPTAVRDLRADTRSERARTRMAQPMKPTASRGMPRMKAR